MKAWALWLLGHEWTALVLVVSIVAGIIAGHLAQRKTTRPGIAQPVGFVVFLVAAAAMYALADYLDLRIP